ncbi:MAG TPA: class I SAM-dependent methyltransferase [Candidatus Acidoferrales bacterium]|nr:class I SAM-dependent methyltransferase [Candidatus Acidoferrales bacterium]
MSSAQSVSMPTPERIFDTINAYQQSEALKAAIELEIFTAIGEGENEAAKIAKRCKCSERGARILCDYLVTIGFLTKEQERYGLAPDAAMFLDGHSPAAMGSITNFLLSPAITDPFRNFAAAVRKGGTAASEHGTLEVENPAWVDFARSMAPMMAMPAELIAQALGSNSGKPWRVLDIAAGHGIFGIAIAKQNPNAQIYAADWRNVLEVARENALRAGVIDRYHTIPGDAFTTELGDRYDVVLLTNFLHHFDLPTCEKFLKRIHTAMAAGGRAVVLDFIPNEDRVSPAMPARFALIMLGTTPSGDAYTLGEYKAMFQRAGFSSCEQVPMPIGEQVLMAQK